MSIIICLHGSFSPVTEVTRDDKINQARRLAIKLETNFCFDSF